MSSGIPYERVKTALLGVNIVEIVEDFYDLEEPTNYVYPFKRSQHENISGNAPDTFVNFKTQVVYCVICGVEVDALRFMMNQGLSFGEALEYLERRVKDE